MPGLGTAGAVVGLLTFGTLTSLIAKIGAPTSSLTVRNDVLACVALTFLRGARAWASCSRRRLRQRLRVCLHAELTLFLTSISPSVRTHEQSMSQRQHFVVCLRCWVRVKRLIGPPRLASASTCACFRCSPTPDPALCKIWLRLHPTSPCWRLGTVCCIPVAFHSCRRLFGMRALAAALIQPCTNA